MIGLVIVSHSEKLAEGVRELAEQMTQGKVKIAAAGGIDDDENPIGTDAMRVFAAIEDVYSDDGVVVLMDLGSAIMSAEMATEFLDPDQMENVHLCEAPLVEGALAAAVQASIGADVPAVMAEARAALTAKISQLADVIDIPAPESTETASIGGDSLTITVPNKLGLHARPAAKLVSLAGQFDATLTIQKGEKTVNARSITQVNTLGARHGDQLTFYADGTDAAKVLEAVQALVDDNFGDIDKPKETTVNQPLIPQENAPDGVLAGIPASNGIAIGTAKHLTAQTPEIKTHTIEDTTAEGERLSAAVNAGIDELKIVIAETKRKVGSEEAGIFEAHQLILQDPDLIEAAQTIITSESRNAESAWWGAIEQMAAQYRAIDDAYMQARADDVLDVGRRVLGHLMPEQTNALNFDEPCILLAKDLSPSDTAQLDPAVILGIVTEQGGATGHSAIIARGLGIPAVVGTFNALTQIRNGATIAVDGEKGYVWKSPTDDQLAKLQQQQEAWQTYQREFRENSEKPAITKDGKQIEVAANIGNPKQAKTCSNMARRVSGCSAQSYCLWIGRRLPQKMNSSRHIHRQHKHLSENPVIIRTLDVGGDKPISYIKFDHEENPFLGHRGIRYWLDTPDIATTQLRAVCRASAQHNIKVMFPMVGTLEEVRQARELLETVQQELETEEIPYNPHMEVGIMIEVPAAVMIARQLAVQVDFFSVGTNDLTQYIMAADRGNPKVEPLVSPFQPAVLQTLKQITDAARDTGIWVGMCGEMAGNPLATALLVGLGFTELSMNAPAIAEVKAKIRSLDTNAAQKL